MRAMVVRQKLVLAAVATAGAALLAACGPNAPTAPPADPTGTGGLGTIGPVGPKANYKAGALLVSNGTSTVMIGDSAVGFPTTVTDAAFSHDGSRIAFVDADGNIATAHPDGTGVVVVTKKAAGVTRSSPTWFSNQIIYTHRAKDGTARLYIVASNGGDAYKVPGYGENDTEIYYNETSDSGNTAPSASAKAGPGVEIAYQHAGAKGAEVWVVDTNQREPHAAKIADGAAAEVSPDGSKVAFVAPNGQLSVIATKVDGAKPVQVTFDAASPSHLAWSPDGARIAYQTSGGVESVAAKPTSATANAATKHAAKPGVPTFAPAARDRVTRISDADPIQAAITVSQLRFPKQPEYTPRESSSDAIGAILTGTTGVGATAATVSALTDRYATPLLFTHGAGLDARTKAELRRLLGTTSADNRPLITIVGGTDVVSTQAEKDVKALGYDTERLAAADLSTRGLAGTGSADVTYFVVDLNDATGLAAAASYAVTSIPLLYSQNGVLPARAKTLINSGTAKITIVPLDTAGEQAAKASWSGKPSTLTVAPLIGTNADRLRSFGSGAGGVVLVDRTVVADVLVATSLGRSVGYAVVAVDGGAALDPAVAAWLDATSGTLDDLIVVDSGKKVGQPAIDAVMRAISGPFGFAEAPPAKA